MPDQSSHAVVADRPGFVLVRDTRFLALDIVRKLLTDRGRQLVDLVVDLGDRLPQPADITFCIAVIEPAARGICTGFGE